MFLAISQFLERTLIDHIDMKNRLDSKLQFCYICSIEILSRKWDVFEKPQQLNSKPSIMKMSLSPFLGRSRARRRRGRRTQPKAQLPNRWVVERDRSGKVEIKISGIGALSIGETESRNETASERVGRLQELTDQGRVTGTPEQTAPGWRWARSRGKVSFKFRDFLR